MADRVSDGTSLEQRLRELRELAEKATPGLWERNVSRTKDGFYRAVGPEVINPTAAGHDADFLVALVNAWPQLADALAAHVAARSALEQELADANQQLGVLRPGGRYAWKEKCEAAESSCEASQSAHGQHGRGAAEMTPTDELIEIAGELEDLSSDGAPVAFAILGTRIRDAVKQLSALPAPEQDTATACADCQKPLTICGSCGWEKR